MRYIRTYVQYNVCSETVVRCVLYIQCVWRDSGVECAAQCV